MDWVAWRGVLIWLMLGLVLLNVSLQMLGVLSRQRGQTWLLVQYNIGFLLMWWLWYQSTNS